MKREDSIAMIMAVTSSLVGVAVSLLLANNWETMGLVRDERLSVPLNYFITIALSLLSYVALKRGMSLARMIVAWIKAPRVWSLGEKIMKRVLVIFGVSVLAATAIFFGLWINTKRQSKPLYGNFDIGMKCMGGHEIFFDLDATDAYENCPSHRWRKRLGRIVRTKDSVIFLDPREATWFRIDWDGSGYSSSYIDKEGQPIVDGPASRSPTIHQVTNPWRLLLPRFLPER